MSHSSLRKAREQLATSYSLAEGFVQFLSLLARRKLAVSPTVGKDLNGVLCSRRDKDDASPSPPWDPGGDLPSSFSLIRVVWTADPAQHVGSRGYCLPRLGNGKVLAVFALMNRQGSLDVEYTHRVKVKGRRAFKEQSYWMSVRLFPLPLAQEIALVGGTDLESLASGSR